MPADRPAPGRAGRSQPQPQPQPRTPTGPIPRPGTGPMPRAASGPGQRGGGRPQPPAADWADWPDPNQQDYYGSQQDYPPEPGYRSQAPWDGGMPEPDPTLRYREPGPGMPGYRGSRDARYGGDRR